MTNHNQCKGIELEVEPEERNLAHATSDCGALLHIIKSSLGAGVLAMPFAFQNAGSVFGIVAAIATGIIIIHTTAILVECSQNLCKIYNKKCMSYADTAEYALYHGFKGKIKQHASKARFTINFFLFLTYYGVLTYYVVLISSTFTEVLNQFFNINVNVRIYTLCALILIYPAGIIKLLKYLVPFSASANAFLILALGTIFFETLRDLPAFSSMPTVKPVNNWPLFFATAFTSMEGIGVILPLENEMKNPTHLIQSPGLLYIGMIFSVVINTVVGLFGYWRYGEAIKGAVSLNLPFDWVSQCVKITVALCVLCTFGLQMTAPMKVVWDGVGPAVAKENAHRCYYLIRSGLIIGNVLLATIMPSIGGVISLVGAMGFSILGIFCPAVIQIICLWDEDRGFIKWRLIKNIILIVFSVLSAGSGIYCSIQEMAKS